MTVSNIRIGFIGFGNMGQAICDGLLRADAVDPEKIHACANNLDRLTERADRRGINACRSAYETVDNADIVIVAVKPNVVRGVLEPIKDKLMGKAVVSVAAGCDFDFYEEFLIDGTNHISTIPNTPVEICKGAIVCEETHSLTTDQMTAFKRIFSAIGTLEFIDTEHMSAAGTISGCSPAFAAMFIEAIGDAGVKYGLKREAAYRLIAQTLSGTGALYIEKGEHPGRMKDSVCSPGGTTIKGVSALEEYGLRNALIKAIDAIEGK